VLESGKLKICALELQQQRVVNNLRCLLCGNVLKVLYKSGAAAGEKGWQLRENC
jgi:hypothetical protein